MIGSFGEVYLVDWGIAVSLVPDPLGRLPLAADEKEIAGTPCYMAPEMLGAVGTLSERTDVYLLGAILHEILTGEPPHTGNFRQIITSVLLSTFVYDASVPRELADIARRAMSRQPEDRFASAEELRLRLEWYLRHRGSLAISAEATRRLDDMQALVGSEAPAGRAPRPALSPVRGVPIRLPPGDQGVGGQRDRAARAASRDRDRRSLRARARRRRRRRGRARRDREPAAGPRPRGERGARARASPRRRSSSASSSSTPTSIR